MTSPNPLSASHYLGFKDRTAIGSSFDNALAARFAPTGLLEKCVLYKHRFGSALLVRSARNRSAIGIETHVVLVRTRADTGHHQGSSTRVAELIVAASRKNDHL